MTGDAILIVWGVVGALICCGASVWSGVVSRRQLGMRPPHWDREYVAWLTCMAAVFWPLLLVAGAAGGALWLAYRGLHHTGVLLGERLEQRARWRELRQAEQARKQRERLQVAQEQRLFAERARRP